MSSVCVDYNWSDRVHDHMFSESICRYNTHTICTVAVDSHLPCKPRVAYFILCSPSPSDKTLVLVQPLVVSGIEISEQNKWIDVSNKWPGIRSACTSVWPLYMNL